jgi:GH24 family phage-related lysozyme (muramidase)
MHAGQHEEGPDQRQRWHRAEGKVLKGIARRLEAEAALYELRWSTLTLRVHFFDTRLL